MIPRPLLVGLLLAAVGLPITVLVLLGAGGLLAAMQDAGAAAAVGRVALACGIAWVADLIALLLALGVNAAGGSAPHEPGRRDDSSSAGREP